MITVYNLPNGRTLNITPCDSGESPREWSNLSKLVFFGGYSHLGDNHNVDTSECTCWEDNEAAIIKHYGKKDVAVIIPIYGYSHGGLSISTTPFSCRWDSGQLGYAVVLKSDIRENWGIKRVTEKYVDMSTKQIEGEIKVLNQYANGEVYSFEIKDVDGEHEDSCSGFFGSDILENGILDYIGKEDWEWIENSLK